MMNSMEWYASYMGILKTGATVTPLNFRFASADIKYAADVTKCKAFLLGDQFIGRVEPIMKEMDYCKHFICLGANVPSQFKSYNEIVEKGDSTPILADTKDDDMAELMFTSEPPERRNPCAIPTRRSSISASAMPSLITRATTASISPLIPSITAARSSSPSPAISRRARCSWPWRRKPEFYLKAIADEKCTGGWNTVPTWSDVINAIKTGQVDLKNYDLSALRHIEIGAQPVPYVLLEDSKKIFPNLPIANIYGITEGGGGGTLNCYDEDIMRKPGSIGKATAFMEAKIVDGDGNRLTGSKVGELLLKGPRLMKEYAFKPGDDRQDDQGRLALHGRPRIRG